MRNGFYPDVADAFEKADNGHGGALCQKEECTRRSSNVKPLPWQISRVEPGPPPLGTELSSDERALAEALGWLQTNTATTGKRLRTMLHAALSGRQSGFEKALARMGLEKQSGFRQRLMQRLLRYALQRTVRIDS